MKQHAQSNPSQRLALALQQAQQALRAGDPALALSELASLPAAEATDWRALHMQGLALLAQGDDAPAAQALSRACAEPAAAPEVFHALARARLSMGDGSGAVDALRAALARFPRHPPTVARLGELLIVERRTDEARDLIAPLLAADPIDPLILVVHARLALENRADPHARADAASRLHAALSRADLDPFARTRCLYRLAAIRDAMGDAPGAMDALSQASQTKRGPHDPDVYQRWIDTLIRNWTIAAWARARDAADAAHRANPAPRQFRPVFIVGMPRSGSTLVEQVLAAHPEIAAGGEHLALQRALDTRVIAGRHKFGLVFDPARFTPEVVLSARDDYMGRVGALMPGAARPTDKMLSNFQHLGATRLLFPHASIIHCVRHPLDTCLSCHFQDFTSGNVFAQDQTHLGRYFNDYARLMDHWGTLPGIDAITVRYETLVQAPERESRRLIDALGLAWNEACLRPHEQKGAARTASAQQVSKPVYRSSVGRWHAYREFLRPLTTALDAERVRTYERAAAES